MLFLLFSKVHINFLGKILKHLVINDCRFCEHHTSHNSLLTGLGQQFLIGFVTRFPAKRKKTFSFAEREFSCILRLHSFPYFLLAHLHCCDTTVKRALFGFGFFSGRKRRQKCKNYKPSVLERFFSERDREGFSERSRDWVQNTRIPQISEVEKK